jgi:parallel beta-helix repeat protein
MFRSALRKLLTPKSVAPIRRPAQSRLAIENLEDRTVPTTFNVTANSASSLLSAIGSGASIINIPAGTYNLTSSLVIPASAGGVTLQSTGGTVTIDAPAVTTDVTIGGTDVGGAVIDIYAKNVTINGLTVNGAGSNANAGIRVIEGGSATIKNNIVENLTTPTNPASGNGIQIGTSLLSGTSGAGTAKVTGNTVSNYLGAGVLVDGGSASAQVKNDTITGRGAANNGATNYGVQVSRGATARVQGNTITGNDDGTGGNGTQSAGIFFYQDGGKNSIAALNTVSGNQDGILIQNSNGTCAGAIEIVNNSVSGNDGYAGIDVDASNNIDVENNSVTNNTGFNGIALTNTTNTEIENNCVSGNSGDGIFDFQGNTNFLWANTSFNNGNDGIYVQSTTNDQIWNNVTYGNGTAVGAAQSGNTGNNFANGILVIGGGSNDIWLGASSNNDQDGILLMNTTGNTIVGNVIQSNGRYGVNLLGATNTLIAFNLITGNNAGAINYDSASSYTGIGNRTGTQPTGQGTCGAGGDCSVFDHYVAGADNDCSGLAD